MVTPTTGPWSSSGASDRRVGLPAVEQQVLMTHRWVRTYAGRRGRHSALTRERLDRFLPEREVAPGPIDPVAEFAREAPFVLEIGCGHGAAAVAYAEAFPDRDIVAVDVHTPGIARLLARADEAGVPNLRVVVGDAMEVLADRLGEGVLDAVHLFFPDPWPKARHAKRRFISAYSLDLVDDRLRPGGVLRVATDQQSYAEHTLTELASHGRWTVTVGERPAWRPVEGFEAKGLAAGRAITEITATLAC